MVQVVPQNMYGYAVAKDIFDRVLAQVPELATQAALASKLEGSHEIVLESYKCHLQAPNIASCHQGKIGRPAS